MFLDLRVASHDVATIICPVLACGGTAGSVFWGVMLPVDVAKTRYQIARAGAPDDLPLLQLMRRVYTHHGGVLKLITRAESARVKRLEIKYNLQSCCQVLLLISNCTRTARGGARTVRRSGGAVQVDPIKPTLKAPGIKLLKLEYDNPLSKFAFKINLRRYSVGPVLLRAFPTNAVQFLVGRCRLTP